MADIMETSTNPAAYDFSLNTYDGSGNLTERKCYLYRTNTNISGATHNAGTVTITTTSDHKIMLPWSGSVTYGLGVVVTYGNKIFRSLTGTGNTNKNPLNETSYWEKLVNIDSVKSGLEYNRDTWCCWYDRY